MSTPPTMQPLESDLYQVPLGFVNISARAPLGPVMARPLAALQGAVEGTTVQDGGTICTIWA